MSDDRPAIMTQSTSVVVVARLSEERFAAYFTYDNSHTVVGESRSGVLGALLLAFPERFGIILDDRTGK